MKNFNQKIICNLLLFLIKQFLIKEFAIDPTFINESIIILEMLKKKLFL